MVGMQIKFSTKNVILFVAFMTLGKFINDLVMGSFLEYGQFTAAFISLCLSLLFLVVLVSAYILLKRVKKKD
jgi:hypothetical protein